MARAASGGVSNKSVSPACKTISPILPLTASPSRWTATMAALWRARNPESRGVRPSSAEPRATTASTSTRWGPEGGGASTSSSSPSGVSPRILLRSTTDCSTPTNASKSPARSLVAGVASRVTRKRFKRPLDGWRGVRGGPNPRHDERWRHRTALWLQSARKHPGDRGYRGGQEGGFAACG